MSKNLEGVVIERALVLMDKGWARGDWAVDVNGEEVAYWSKKAVAFCAAGSIYRAVLEVTGRRCIELGRSIEERIDYWMDNEGLMAINDSAGKAAAMKAMRGYLKAGPLPPRKTMWFCEDISYWKGAPKLAKLKQLEVL